MVLSAIHVFLADHLHSCAAFFMLILMIVRRCVGATSARHRANVKMAAGVGEPRSESEHGNHRLVTADGCYSALGQLKP
jgi:hypothetical protein